MPILGVLKHFVEDFKLQFIEKTGINIKARFALWGFAQPEPRTLNQITLYFPTQNLSKMELMSS